MGGIVRHLGEGHVVQSLPSAESVAFVDRAGNEQVVAILPEEMVLAAAVREAVVAAAPEQLVVAGTVVEDVVALPAHEGVVAFSAAEPDRHVGAESVHPELVVAAPALE